MRKFRTAVIVLFVAGSWTGVSAQYGQVTLDSVTHQRSSTTLSAGNTHQVYIAYDFTDYGQPNWGVTGANGFEVYSPDGANWGYLLGVEGPGSIASAPASTRRYLKHMYYDGIQWDLTGNDGADPAGGSTGSASRAGFYMATVDFFGDGWPPEQDIGTAVILEFTSDPDDIGLTICVDSAGAITAWEWVSGLGTFPRWDNGLGESAPRCFEIVDCCQGRVGDANGIGGDEPTIGDVVDMISMVFLSGTPVECLKEADVNLSGGGAPREDNITISDISILIDYLFITGPELGLPDCP